MITREEALQKIEEARQATDPNGAEVIIEANEDFQVIASPEGNIEAHCRETGEYQIAETDDEAAEWVQQVA